MAKKQTFGDKMGKGKGADKPVVKVIKGFKDDQGTTRFVEQFVKVNDMNEVTKLDINE